MLAYRGCLIGDELARKKQLSQKAVGMSRRLSRVRIHIERVISLQKNRYTILLGILPISLIKRDVDTEYATVENNCDHLCITNQLKCVSGLI